MVMSHKNEFHHDLVKNKKVTLLRKCLNKLPKILATQNMSLFSDGECLAQQGRIFKNLKILFIDSVFAESKTASHNKVVS